MKNWKTTGLVLFLLLAGFGLMCGGSDDRTTALNKDPYGTHLSLILDSILIPQVDFREASINDVVKFLIDASKQVGADKAGVNIVLMDNEKTSPITMSLRDVTLHKAVNLVAQATGLSVGLENGIVVLRKLKDQK